MPIKRQDGSIYKLTGPNPIMSKQDFWADDAVLLNFNPPEIITSNQQPDPPKQYVPEQPQIQTVTAHVLPIVIKETVDSLYGEVRKNVAYGNRMTIKAVVINENDLSISLWSDTKLMVNSIIYLDRRWWRLQNITERSDGWLMECNPSNQQPSF